MVSNFNDGKGKKKEIKLGFSFGRCIDTKGR